MNKGVKITLVIVTGVLVVAAVLGVLWGVGVFSFGKEKALPTVDVSEMPLGLEWGMSMAEVDEILASHPEYILTQGEGKRMQIYQVTNFQGIESVSGKVVISFDETDRLRMVFYSFASINLDYGMCVPKQLELTQKSLIKELDANYEKGHDIYALVGIEEAHSMDHWLGNKTLFTVQANGPDKLILNYEDIEFFPELVELLRDPDKFSKEYMREQLNY